ncbi:MAG TPA: RluA family pseudouridine synthase [Bacteroidia bacterium]|nr:RluA family pseudouridine synthase [Bacteroidia bacterium]
MGNPEIIYEDEVLLVCNKPAGLMVEPDRNNFPNLLQQVKNYLKEKTGSKLPYAQHLHRLDRPVSGVVLFTKNKDYLKHLSEQFANRTVAKHYLAFTATAPVIMTGTLEQWHRKEKKKAMLVPEGTPYAEKVKLSYSVKAYNQYFLWDIELHTGKFHQIRVQLASLNCPIIGDTLYGSITTHKPDAIALHAAKLIIEHPVTHKQIEFVAGNNNFLNM